MSVDAYIAEEYEGIWAREMIEDLEMQQAELKQLPNFSIEDWKKLEKERLSFVEFEKKQDAYFKSLTPPKELAHLYKTA